MWWRRLDKAAREAMRDDVVYWIVPAGARIRHGITEKPGAWPAGTVVTALCGRPVKIPCSSGSTQSPTRGITERCPGCEREYDTRDYHSTVWDF